MPLKRHITAFDEQAEVLATMDLGKMWDRFLGEFLAEWERMNRLNLADDELERRMLAFIEDLSDAPVTDLARTTSNVAYNQGRDVEILSAAAMGQVEFAVLSEILDENTCANCAWRAQSPPVVEVGSDEYWRLHPPGDCLGGDRCRAFYIPVSGGGANA